MADEDVEQLFFAPILSAQLGMGTMVYDAVEHVVFAQIRMFLLEEKISEKVENTSKLAEPLKHLATGCSATKTSLS